MDINKKYQLEVESILDDKEAQISALRLRCANQSNKIAKLEKELNIFKLTTFNGSDLGDVLPDLLKPQAE